MEDENLIARSNKSIINIVLSLTAVCLSISLSLFPIFHSDIFYISLSSPAMALPFVALSPNSQLSGNATSAPTVLNGSIEGPFISPQNNSATNVGNQSSSTNPNSGLPVNSLGRGCIVGGSSLFSNNVREPSNSASNSTSATMPYNSTR